MPRLRSDAVVLEEPSKGRVRVAVGPLKLWVESRRARRGRPGARARRRRARRRAQLRRRAGPNAVDNTLNLKGMRVDDALSMMESFIDRLYTTDTRVGYVLHGHGTGALREAVRKHLQDRASRTCATAAPAQRRRGRRRGHGVLPAP